MAADAHVRSVMITGANSGVGKELARQLGTRPEIERVVLACRNPDRAESARAELVAGTGRAIFEVAILDTAEPDSTRSAARALAEPVDAVVLNAGGMGGAQPAAPAAGGATEIFAVNVLGHVALLDALIDGRKLSKAAILAGSEAARGVLQFGIKRPSFADPSVAAFARVIDAAGQPGRGFNAMNAYGVVKYLGALWIGALARQHPELRLVTMSPGSTSGTGAAHSMATVRRLAFDHILMGPIGSTLGLSHSVAAGARRLADAVTDPAYGDGIFYASRANRLTGPVVDQASILPDFADPRFQDNAAAAIHQFL